VEIVFPRRSGAERAARRGVLEGDHHLFWLVAKIAQLCRRCADSAL
jgi:hypothetical protein